MKLSTAVSHIDNRLSARHFLIGLMLAYAAIWIWAAWDPVYRFDWFLENMLTIVTIIVLGSGLYLWLARRRSSIEVEIAELERAEARLAAE